MRFALVLAALLPLMVASSNMWAGQSGEARQQNIEWVKFYCFVTLHNCVAIDNKAAI